MYKPIKVLFISHAGDLMGGATYSLLNLINAVKDSVEPFVVVPHGGQTTREFEKRGIKYFIVPFNNDVTSKKGVKKILFFIPWYLRNIVRNYFALKALGKIICQHEINIIHTNTSITSIGAKLSSQFGIKHVWHLREFIDLDFNLSPYKGWSPFLRQIYQSDATISISSNVFKHFRLDSHKNHYTIFNAVKKSDEVRNSKKKGNYILFCAAHIIKSKGIEESFTAFSYVHKRYPQLKYTVAGYVSKPYLSHLVILAEKLGIKDSVEFVGYQNSVDDLMASAICLLMCSNSEAFGRVTAEAMFNGCAIVGNAKGGTVEIINDNETGFLYSGLDELARKIIYVIENEAKVDIVIQQAQTFAVNNFSEVIYSDKIMGVYQSLIQN